MSDAFMAAYSALDARMKIAGRKKLLAKAKFDSSKKMFAVTTELSNKKEESRGHAAH